MTDWWFSIQMIVCRIYNFELISAMLRCVKYRCTLIKLCSIYSVYDCWCDDGVEYYLRRGRGIGHAKLSDLFLVYTFALAYLVYILVDSRHWIHCRGIPIHAWRQCQKPENKCNINRSSIGLAAVWLRVSSFKSNVCILRVWFKLAQHIIHLTCFVLPRATYCCNARRVTDHFKVGFAMNS